MRWRALFVLPLLAGCAAPMAPAPSLSPSQQTVTSLELEYVQKFLVPAAAYDLLPRCPQPPRHACSDATTIERLRAAQVKLHDMIHALRSFTDAAPTDDATTLIGNARASLAGAEALLPAKGGAP